MSVEASENGIKVKIIADSVSYLCPSDRIVTFELEYPRIIHSELMTHRWFSRNAMSSRAIPIKKMIEQVRTNPAMPVKFGKNQPGMQDAGDHDAPVWIGWEPKEFGEEEEIYGTPQQAWQQAANSAASWAACFDAAGYHKQVANRLLEPFQRMKTVLTATEFENFWWLRVDKDADPTIYALAEAMHNAFKESTPELLKAGQWHTPYVYHSTKANDSLHGYYVVGDDGWPVDLTEQEAIAISASCCAQVSYRSLDTTKNKALSIYERLLSGNKVHASPFEHQATPMQHRDQLSRNTYMMANHEINQDTSMWEEGVTHVDREGLFWSGNLRGWRQHRQLLNNHVVRG